MHSLSCCLQMLLWRFFRSSIGRPFFILDDFQGRKEYLHNYQHPNPRSYTHLKDPNFPRGHNGRFFSLIKTGVHEHVFGYSTWLCFYWWCQTMKTFFSLSLMLLLLLVCFLLLPAILSSRTRILRDQVQVVEGDTMEEGWLKNIAVVSSTSLTCLSICTCRR